MTWGDQAVEVRVQTSDLSSSVIARKIPVPKELERPQVLPLRTSSL